MRYNKIIPSLVYLSSDLEASSSATGGFTHAGSVNSGARETS